MHLVFKILIVSFLVYFFSCSDRKSNPTTENTNSPVTAVIPDIPGINNEIYTKLLDSCTYIDYIFHNLPFSLSQSDDSDINQNIMFIDINKPVGKLDPTCKPIARKFFLIKGKSAYDVDVYLSEKCNYYVFVDKAGKPLYANQMTESGRNFYNNIIKQVTGATSTGNQ